MKREKKDGSSLRGKMVFLATGNFNKFNEARIILKDFGFASAMLNIKTIEIQNDNLAEIAKRSVIDAFSKCRLPLIAEDAGLFVHALKGFPGPYAAYVYKTISNPGILRLMEKVENRKATFRSVIAYYDGKDEPLCFEGETHGEIADKEMWGNSKNGFGFDPIFVPEGEKKTFAEMPIMEKNQLSHRGKGVRKFAEWYRTQG